MAIVEINPGICGFHARVVASDDGMMNVTLEIHSDCAHIQAVAAQLGPIAAWQELSRPISETAPYRLAAQNHVHAACPVIAGMLKAVEVAAGMALPADVGIIVRRD